MEIGLGRADPVGEVRGTKVALAPFLRTCPALTTLGLRAAIDNYPKEAKDLLRHATRIFFPTVRFADIFEAVEKPTFPSAVNYRFQRSRILQQILFQYLNIPHPHTRLYFGKQEQQLLQRMNLPMIIMGPHAHTDTVHSVDSSQSLENILSRYNPILVRGQITWTERIRLIWVRFECIGAQIGTPPEATLFEPISPEHPFLQEPLSSTRQIVRRMHLDDIMVEWVYGNGKWQISGMGRPPVRWETGYGVMHRYRYVRHLIESGRL